MLWLPIRIIKLLSPTFLPYNVMLYRYLFQHLISVFFPSGCLLYSMAYLSAATYLRVVSAAMPPSASCPSSCCCFRSFCRLYWSRVTRASGWNASSTPGRSQQDTCCMPETHTHTHFNYNVIVQWNKGTNVLLLRGGHLFVAMMGTTSPSCIPGRAVCWQRQQLNLQIPPPGALLSV